jgi:hypothetical protein
MSISLGTSKILDLEPHGDERKKLRRANLIVSAKKLMAVRVQQTVYSFIGVLTSNWKL